MRALLKAWSPHVILSLSFSFFRLIPWSTGALCIHFPAWASKTHSRRCLGGAPSAIWEGACSLHEQSKSPAGALLGFCVNQGTSASFLSSIFLTAKFFPYLFLYFSQLPTPSSWGNPWIQPGQDPGILEYLICIFQALLLLLLSRFSRVWLCVTP